MVTTSITRKIPGGKLVRLDITFSDQIESAKITGDFFLHPEDTLDDLTAAVRNATLPLDPDGLLSQLDRVLSNHDAQFIGASSKDLVSILQEALACRPSE